MPPDIDVLDAATLAQFDGGVCWTEIVKIEPLRPKSWWRRAIMESEDAGFIRWRKRSRRGLGCWELTDVGREYVRWNAHGEA